MLHAFFLLLFFAILTLITTMTQNAASVCHCTKGCKTRNCRCLRSGLSCSTKCHLVKKKNLLYQMTLRTTWQTWSQTFSITSFTPFGAMINAGGIFWVRYFCTIHRNHINRCQWNIFDIERCSTTIPCRYLIAVDLTIQNSSSSLQS